ncbi:protease III [Escherichia coli]|nr:protease III [Escherichia coli]
MRQAVIFPANPKADVSLILRNPKAMDSARNQVMFALNDYLAGLALDQLSNQASVGGISFSTNANNGLMVNANGYTQRLPQLFQALLEGTLAIPLRKISLSRRSPGITR